uniref:Isopentenyl transferase PjIPT1b n=1 Tax=Phtheirospermum japonicum TaxID=374723 RepID=A0A8F7KP86_9LAMI|nr:isopentenyl transferase PjIPT1b [Phtheirospermum japonicum]
MSTTTPSAAARKKVVVILGPTGCGKTKLSIDLASKAFPSSEIINSDKIQVYRGLDITTNKVPLPDRQNVPHHLLGEFDSSESHPEFTPSDFRSSASETVSDIISRDKLPFVAGGSNSFVYALLAKKFNPESDVFAESDSAFCRELRYECCFLWVDVSLPVLNQYIIKRVDDMLDAGMFEELSEYLNGIGPGRLDERGLNRAIGVPEFERVFRGAAAYEEAVREVKDNTWELVKRQVGKIRRLREEAGWEMNRVDTTGALRAKVAGVGRREAADIWEREVLEPSVEIVKRFLME